PLRKLYKATDHRPGTDFGKCCGCAGWQTTEYIDRRLGHDTAYPPRFRKIGNEEGSAAGSCKRMRDGLDATAVTVRLDHGCAFGRHGAAAEGVPVGLEGGQIDGQNAASLGSGGARLQDLSSGHSLRSQAGSEGRFSLRHGWGLAAWAAAVHEGGRWLLRSLRQPVFSRERGETGDRRIELQFDSAGGPVTLFADDDFRLAVHLVGVRQPFREFFPVGFQRFAHLVVIFLTINEQNNVGVLLD